MRGDNGGVYFEESDYARPKFDVVEFCRGKLPEWADPQTASEERGSFLSAYTRRDKDAVFLRMCFLYGVNRGSWSFFRVLMHEEPEYAMRRGLCMFTICGCVIFAFGVEEAEVDVGLVAARVEGDKRGP